MRTINKLFNHSRLILCLLLLAFVSCNTNDISPDVAKEGDYFPLTEDTQWEYLFEHLATDGTDDLWSSATLTYSIDGEFEVDGKTYKNIVDSNGELVKIVRREGSKYYGRNHELYGGFSHEYMFLNTEAKVNSSWHYIKDNGTKTEYIVKNVGTTHTINDIEYKDVIELNVNYYIPSDNTGFELIYTTKHYYAKGVGEIYAYYPYPSLSYSNLNISLITHQ